MDQTTRGRRSSKRKREREREPESEDQNEACKVPVVEDPNKDVQSNSTTTSSMTDLTLPSSSKSHWDYDVFLSFRGKDTRKNFTDHLYSALKQVGIHTFRDNEELPRGENISTELLNAILESRIFIVVFSKSYASSRWCLNELVEIVNCKKTRGQTLLPIFYHVDSSDVRKQTGPFAKAFSSHEALFQTDMERVQRWRAALTEATNCSGWDLDANGYESIIIQEIVEEVLCKVNPAHLDVAIHPVGLQSRIEEIKVLLNLGTNDIRIVGFHGMGGIGKTTLAKAVYNEIYHLFEGSSFLSNVKEISNESNGLVHLQEQLLYDILHKKNWNVYNVHRGISLIKERIQGKKVLVVVDDVDHLDQLHALVGNFKSFDSRSRLIVTTRNEQLLTLLEVDEKYKVEELNHRESLQLFKWHAFKMTHPIKEHLELSVSVVKYAGGLPLALVVLGSSLFGKSVDEWKSKLKKLQKIPDAEIQKKLKISFDSLDDDDETKDIFIDIACFFIGMEKEDVIKILHACDFFVDDGLSILIQRSLVTIDDNKLRMHDLIRDMGRGIVLAESPHNPGKRSRLWFYKDILNVLSKHMGSDTVKGLILNLPVLEDVHLKTEGFTNMKNLRLLQINNVHLTGSYEHLSKELKWLCWHKCPLKLLPQNFYLENLVILDMQQSNVKQVWKKKKNFNKLKVLNLSNSKDLTTSPDFSQVPQLEILILEGCTGLVHVHESIGHLKRLVSLNLKNCTNLKDLPRSIFNLKSLETLDLSGCLALKKLPEQLSSSGVLKNLKTLSLYGCSHLTELPNFLQAPHLKSLVLEGCTSLAKIHESIGLLKRLVLLDLRRCENLWNLPSSISNLESLETLDLSGCLALEKLPEQLPSSFGFLKNLKTVSFYGCSRLSALPNFLHATHLESLKLEGCTNLVEIHESVGLLKRLVLLDLRRCEKLKNLPSSISNLESLEILDLSGCLELYKLPEHLENMTALWKLVADGTAIEQLPSSLGLLRNLSVLSLSGCGGPSSSWRSPKSSNYLSLPPSISRLCSLRELNLSDRNLSEDEIPIEFGFLSSLEILDLSRNNFQNLPICINYLHELQYLYLNECTTLQSISLHKSVQLLGANGCTSLERILILTNESLGSFYLDNCHKLARIECLKSMQPGSAVFMGRCNNLAYDFMQSAVLQMVCKTDGDCSFCLPGIEIPNWISHQTIGSLISFHVPSFFDGQIGRLLLCVVYGVNKEAPKLSRQDGLFKLTFCNKSFKDPHMSYWRTCFDISEDHICAQVMQLNQIGLEINSGDEIELSVDLLIDSRPMEDHQQSIKVNKCGIHLLPGCGGPSSSRLPPFSELCSLTELYLNDCSLCEDDISFEPGCLSSLERLDLSRNNLRNLPSCISSLPKLQKLFLNKCTTLQSISLPRSVIVLGANGCTSLKRISILTNESSGSSYLDNLDRQRKISSSFYLNNCHKLVEIKSLNSLPCVPTTLRMGSCNNLSADFRKSVLQMMCSKTDGICTILLPGSEIPNWIRPHWIGYQKNGSSISIRVPSFLNSRMCKVLLCIVYAVKKEAPRDILAQGGFFRWRLCNKSSRDHSKNWYHLDDIGGDSFLIPEALDIFEDHILAQVRTVDLWRLNRSGDEIEVAIDLQMLGRGDIDNSKMCGIDPQIMEVKRCGIRVL